MTEQDIHAPYKYTFPIEKAFIGEDGKPRLIGAATGPEVDIENQRVHPALIDKWIGQINNGQIQVIYDDWHKKDSESITAELGVIEKAWKNELGHMYVQVLLDEDNPVAQYIHKSALKKGKQYGMSIFGEATRYIDEVVSGKMVRTITDGVLERIAHTTRPVWTPSFGTVLSKAVDTAIAESANGDKSVTEENKTDTPQTEVTTVETTETTTATTDSGAATNPESGTAPSESDASADNDAEAVEKAVKTDSKRDQAKLNKIVKLYGELGTLLSEVGLSGEQAATEADKSVTVQKSETVVETDDTAERFTRIEKAILSLADRIPDGSAPGALRKSEEADPLAELKAVEDPMERLRLGLAVAHGENGTVR